MSSTTTKVEPTDEAAKWAAIRTFLDSPDAEWFVDSIECGDLPAYVAEEVLSDYGIDPTRGALVQLRGVLAAVLA